MIASESGPEDFVILLNISGVFQLKMLQEHSLTNSLTFSQVSGCFSLPLLMFLLTVHASLRTAKSNFLQAQKPTSGAEI